MATSQEFDSSSDQITQVCNFCNTNVSDGYCAECEIHMCQSCFDIHTRAKTCRYHELIDDVNHPNFNKKTFSEPCKQHPSQMLEFYCVDHKIIGCIKCVFPKHKNCNYENVEDAAQQFKDSGEDKHFREKIKRLKKVYTECTQQSEMDINKVAEVNKTVVNDINAFTDRVISYAVKFKTDLLERSERLHRENETCLEKRSSDLDSVGEEIEKCEVKLNTDAHEDKLFIVSVEISPKIKELEDKISSIRRLNTIKKYEFQPNLMTLKMLEESKCLGEICFVEAKCGLHLDERITMKTPENTSSRRQTEYAMGGGNFSVNVNVPACIGPGSSAEKKLQEEMENVGVTMNANGGQKVISAPTSYQMKHANKILTDFVSNVNNQCAVIKDVPEMVWRTVCIICSQAISDIESKCGRKIDFSEEKSQVCLPATEKCMDEKIKELRTEIDNMKQKEISEMKLTSKEAENVENVCKELESAEGMNYWLLDRGMKTVYIYGDSYGNLSKHKTQWEIKIGRKMLKPRGKKGNAQLLGKSKEVTQKPNNQASAVSSLGLNTYVTAEGITVSVYKADIISLDVDCIVNDANGELRHRGGVARVISKRAGSALDTECKEYIRKHGQLNVSQCYSTTAGNLKYRCVIHTVGPAWHDYGRQKHAYNKTDRPCRNKKDCEDDLMLAVWNSFCEAEKQGMKTIALPAISSAIFGVPMDICVTQYVRGVQKYSKKKGHYGSPLLEIHFIDINEDTVRAIQKAFSESLSSASFVHDKTRLDHSSDDEPEKRNKKNDEKPPEPLMFESGSREFQFYFMGNTDNNKLLLCKKDIETLRDISAIVVPVNQRGEGAVINRLISEKVEYKDQFLQDKKRLFEMQRREAGDVVEIPGYGCGFMCILYVVYHRPKTQDTFRVKNLQDVLTNMLRHADSNQRIRSVAIPMFGIVKPGDTEEKPHLSNVKNAMQSMKLQVYNVMSKTEFYDSDKEDEVQMFSLVLLKTYKQFCDEKLKKGSKSPLEVVVMCHTDAMFQIAKKSCADHVLELKASYQEEKPDGAVGKEQQLSSTKEESPSSMGDCVICMEKVTDPKTLRCGHTFCTDCINQQFKYKKQCPTCGAVCGIITGDQPEGKMDRSVRNYMHLPGFEKCGSIVITYYFPDGWQEDHHPSPGTWYKGITRSAYLPNNEEGRKILKMLEIGFKRKVTFTIGNSKKTGQQGVITWNDIHHKTDHRPNTQFGYPDPTYLERVKDELAAKGITEDDIQ